MTGIDSLEDGDPGILAQAPVELPVTDVDGDDVGCVPLKQPIDEPAR